MKIPSVPVFRPVVAVALLAIACELGGIWSELHGLRREQVKNAVYSMNPTQAARLQSTPSGKWRLRQLSGQSAVRIEDTIVDPIYVQTVGAVPVEIQP